MDLVTYVTKSIFYSDRRFGAVLHHERNSEIFPASMAFAFSVILMGFLLDHPSNILPGLYKIITTQDQLITDYFEIAGPGAALVNAGLVTILSLLVIKFTKEPYNGFTIVEVGLMSGFALFGKNIANIWPILFGTWLYSKYQKEPFGKHAGVALLSTALGPLVSYMALGSRHASLLLGCATGLLIGFVLPSLSAYTYKIQNGMNLYNMGFACGLFALMVVPILTAFGDKPDSVLFWAKGYNLQVGIALSAQCIILILVGLFAAKSPLWAVWAGYRRLLSTTGRTPSDYYRMFGPGPVLINVGVNGLIGMAYILLIGGDLNGPTLGGIYTVMGFSAFGKHAFNIIPIMVGICLGGITMNNPVNLPALQIAALFGTTLAPVAGHFGWPFGILAGFIHASLVLQTGGPVAGVNLYNNGFSGGLVATVLYPILTALIRHRRPVLRDQDMYDLFEQDAPIDTSRWRTHKSDQPPHPSQVVHQKNAHLYPELPDDTPDETEDFD